MSEPITRLNEALEGRYSDDGQGSVDLILVENFFEELKARVPENISSQSRSME